jgi:hypothetical protein
MKSPIVTTIFVFGIPSGGDLLLVEIKKELLNYYTLKV